MVDKKPGTTLQEIKENMAAQKIKNINTDSKSSSSSSANGEAKNDFESNLEMLYDVDKYDGSLFEQMKESFMYHGFSVQENLKMLFSTIKDFPIILQLIVLTALRGPIQASKIKLLNGKTPIEMGIPASGGRNTKILTLNKILACTADLAAWALKKMDVKPRIPGELPAWLQFPSAGSIIMPTRYRNLHIEFSKNFSTKIGGSFNEEIYTQMMSNAYLNPKLKLFEELPP